MEEETPEKTHQTVSWWITSLAISITCCAVLFVIFAGFVSDLKKELATMNDEMAQMIMHQDRLLSEMQLLQHALPEMAATAASRTTTSTTAAPAPAAITPPPAPLAPPSATVEQPPVTPVGTTAPTVVTPPAASPTAIPEVPSPPSK